MLGGDFVADSKEHYISVWRVKNIMLQFREPVLAVINDDC
jgi:hypothetical protein